MVRFSGVMLQIHRCFCLRCSAHTWMKMWFWVTLVRCLPLVWLLPHAAHGQGKGGGARFRWVSRIIGYVFFFTSIPAWQPKATMWGKKETLRTYRENVNRPVTVPLLQVFSAHSLEFSGSTSDWLRELFGTSSITHWTPFELFCLDKIRTQNWWHVQTRLLQSADFIPESWNHHSKIIQSKNNNFTHQCWIWSKQRSETFNITNKWNWECNRERDLEDSLDLLDWSEQCYRGCWFNLSLIWSWWWFCCLPFQFRHHGVSVPKS